MTTKRIYLVHIENEPKLSFYDRRVQAYTEQEALELAARIWPTITGIELDKWHYVPYTLDNMIADSGIDVRLKNRIKHLVEVGALSIAARNDGGTFVAYVGVRPLTYKAVLHVGILPGRSGGQHVAVEIDRQPKDYLAVVARICTRFSYLLKSE